MLTRHIAAMAFLAACTSVSTTAKNSVPTLQLAPAALTMHVGELTTFTIGNDTSHSASLVVTEPGAGAVTGDHYRAPLTAGTYHVTAHGSLEGTSNIAVVTVIALPPPQSLSATASYHHVALSWAASDGATQYFIQRGHSPSFDDLIAVTSTSFDDATADPSGPIDYQVLAGNDLAKSAPSNVVTALAQSGHAICVLTAADAVNKYDLAATGNAPPVQRFGDQTTLANATMVAVDGDDSRWFVDAAGLALVGFPPGAHGSVAPTHRLAGPALGLAQITGLGAAGGHLFVGDVSGRIAVFPTSADGNVAPLRVLDTGTGTQPIFAVSETKLYFARQGGVYAVPLSADDFSNATFVSATSASLVAVDRATEQLVTFSGTTITVHGQGSFTAYGVVALAVSGGAIFTANSQIGVNKLTFAGTETAGIPFVECPSGQTCAPPPACLYAGCNATYMAIDPIVGTLILPLPYGSEDWSLDKLFPRTSFGGDQPVSAWGNTSSAGFVDRSAEYGFDPNGDGTLTSVPLSLGWGEIGVVSDSAATNYWIVGGGVITHEDSGFVTIDSYPDAQSLAPIARADDHDQIFVRNCSTASACTVRSYSTSAGIVKIGDSLPLGPFYGLAYSHDRDEIFVDQASTVVVLDRANPTTIKRTLGNTSSGPSSGLAVDDDTGLLLVTGGDTIGMFPMAASGLLTPTRLIAGPQTLLSYPSHPFVCE